MTHFLAGLAIFSSPVVFWVLIACPLRWLPTYIGGTLVNSYNATLLHNPEDHRRRPHWREILRTQSYCSLHPHVLSGARYALRHEYKYSLLQGHGDRSLKLTTRLYLIPKLILHEDFFYHSEKSFSEI